MRPLPLADELFLIGHDEYTGKSVVNGDVLGCGLAGAVVAELLLAGRLTVNDGRVAVYDPRPYNDPVTDAALGEVRRRPDAHPLRDWVEYLAEDVRDMVGRRLAAAGMVQREQTRGLSLRVTVRFPAIDAIKAASPRIRLRYLLDRGEVLDAATATLAALVRATELEPVLLLAAARPQVREQLGHIVETLPPPLRQLVAAVDAAVKAVALTVRR